MLFLDISQRSLPIISNIAGWFAFAYEQENETLFNTAENTYDSAVTRSGCYK